MDKHKRAVKCKVHENDIMRINVRGRVFEVDRGCLLRQPGSRLCQLAQQDSRSPSYFNRNSQLFEHIVDYYVSGSLHFPHSLCMNAVHDELTYWGLDESHLADCCYAHYKEEEETESKRQQMAKDWDFDCNMRRKSSRLITQAKHSWKIWVYLLLEEPHSSTVATIWALVVKAMILLSISVVILETVPGLRVDTSADLMGILEEDNATSYGMQLMTSTIPCTPLLVIEYLTVVFLSIELFLRLAFSPNKKRFFLNFLNLCDLLSLLPCYASALILVFLNVLGHQKQLARAYVILNIVRIVRIFRLYQIARQYQTVQIITASLKESIRELFLFIILLFSASAFFAAVLFYSELDVDNIRSIPLAMWWAVVTMTTVGYGDLHPVTGGGYFVASLCSVAGILIIALPTPIIVNNFRRLYDAYQSCHILSQRHIPRKKKASNSIQQSELSSVENDQLKGDGCNMMICNDYNGTSNDHGAMHTHEQRV